MKFLSLAIALLGLRAFAGPAVVTRENFNEDSETYEAIRRAIFKARLAGREIKQENSTVLDKSWINATLFKFPQFVTTFSQDSRRHKRSS